MVARGSPVEEGAADLQLVDLHGTGLEAPLRFRVSPNAYYVQLWLVLGLHQEISRKHFYFVITSIVDISSKAQAF